MLTVEDMPILFIGVQEFHLCLGRLVRVLVLLNDTLIQRQNFSLTNLLSLRRKAVLDKA